MDAPVANGFPLNPAELAAVSQALVASYLVAFPDLSRIRQEFAAFVESGFKTELIKPMLARLRTPAWRKVEALEVEASNAGISIASYFDDQYPAALRQIADPPLVLFMRGRVPNGDRVAVVGSRRSTPYGERVANSLAQFLAEREISVVSGLARGIDSAAHEGCLAGVAVLGSGVMNIYPAQNERLADRVVAAGGAVISEYGLHSAPQRHFFPERNRLVSGLSRAVVIVEAEERSGALITARLASEQGREVFAVPGQLGSERSSGTHRLIRDGVQILCRFEDLLPFGVQARPPRGRVSKPTAGSRVEFRGVELLAPAERIGKVATLLSDGLVHDFDGMLASLGGSAAELTSVLSELELYGAIRVLPGRRFQYDDYVDMPEIFKQILTPA